MSADPFDKAPEDLPNKPPQEAVDEPRLPAHDFEQDGPTEDTLRTPEEVFADEAEEIVQQLTSAGEAEEDAPDILPDTEAEPEPFDGTALPVFAEPSIADLSGEQGDASLPGIDDAVESAGPQGGEIPELQHLDEAQSALEQMGADIEAFHAGRLGGDIPQLEEESNASVGGMSEDQLRDYMEADYHHRETSSYALIDHARRIEDLTLAIERERI